MKEHINTIINADCMKIMQEIEDKTIDLIITDIPYGEVTKNGAEREKYSGQLRKINKGNADIITFDLKKFISECARITSGSIYIFVE